MAGPRPPRLSWGRARGFEDEAQTTQGAVDGPLDVRSLSAATINEESAESSSSSMSRLMMISLLIIALLLYVFFRSGSDVALENCSLSALFPGLPVFSFVVGQGGETRLIKQL